MESQIKLSQDSQTEVIFRDYSQYWNMILPGTGSEYHIISRAATKVWTLLWAEFLSYVCQIRKYLEDLLQIIAILKCIEM